MVIEISGMKHYGMKMELIHCLNQVILPEENFPLVYTFSKKIKNLFQQNE